MTTTDALVPLYPVMQSANGFVVVSRWNEARYKVTAPTFEHHETLADAVADFDNPHGDYTSLAIFPSRDGVPIGGPLSPEAIEIARRQA